MTENKSFSIVGMYLYDACEYKKVLKHGYYSFNDAYIYDNENKKIEENPNVKLLPEDFFGKNISISAIVGKNGSGKSSLLDMLYRIINNFAFCYIHDNIHRLCTIKGIYADLCFISNAQKYVLSFKDNILELYSNGEKRISIDINKKKVSEFNSEFREIIKNFFYTVVINYSNHSLLPKDYELESTPKDWLTKIFHKSDGYQTPIVLNPYKAYGILHLYNEIELTLVRLQSILIKLNNEKEFVEGYKLKQIEYKILQPDISYAFSNIIRFLIEHHDDKINIKENFSELFKKDSLVQDIGKCIEFFYNTWLTNENCKENIILKAFDIDILKLKKYISEISKISYFDYDQYKLSYILSCIYLTYKVQKIIELPISKERYKDFFNNNSWKELVNKIKENHSHVEFKIHQTLNWILFIKKEMEKGCEQNENTFLHTEILKNINIKDKKLYEICELLPPSFFKASISLKRNDDSIVDFNTLSSGEKQLIFNNSTIVYHILNILSVDTKTKDVFSYRNINIVLDEIELYFHPEYQRKYISNLVDVLNRLDINKQCNINIILSTHSPFLLSDIPKQNILFLEEGESRKTKSEQTFAANISDLLRDSFFLEEGFIGEFAARKIGEIIDAIKDEKGFSFEDYKKYKNIIDLIGEPLIRNKLIVLLDEKYCDDELTFLEAEKDRYSKKIKIIENNIKLLKLKKLDEE